MQKVLSLLLYVVACSCVVNEEKMVDRFQFLYCSDEVTGIQSITLDTVCNVQAQSHHTDLHPHRVSTPVGVASGRPETDLLARKLACYIYWSAVTCSPYRGFLEV